MDEVMQRWKGDNLDYLEKYKLLLFNRFESGKRAQIYSRAAIEENSFFPHFFWMVMRTYLQVTCSKQGACIFKLST